MSWKVVAWGTDQITGSPVTKLVFLTLCDAAPESGLAIVRLKEIARITELSLSAVKRHVQLLADRQLVKIIPRFADGVQLPNAYQMAYPGAVATDAPPQSRGDRPPSHVVAPGGAVVDSKEPNLTEGRTDKSAFEPNARMLRLVEAWNAMADRYKLPRYDKITAGVQTWAMQRHREVGSDEAFFDVIFKITQSAFLREEMRPRLNFALFVKPGDLFEAIRNDAYKGAAKPPKPTAPGQRSAFPPLGVGG